MNSTMGQRFQGLVSGAVLALIIGWVLYVGKGVFVPVVFGVLVVYVVVGLARLMHRIPLLGRALPSPVRYGMSIVAIALALVAAVHEIVTWMDVLLVHAPQYQESVLAAIQQVAAFLRIETEPTWATLRRDLLALVDVQKLVGATVFPAFSFLASVVFVLLCAAFLLLEQRTFGTKLANLTSDPAHAARIRSVISDVNTRIGTYLALKTFLSILLGAVCWVVMAIVGLQFAAFWAVLIALLNFIPYLGSFLGVLLPAAMAIVQFGTLDEVVALLLLLGAAQFVIGNFLDPYVMGNSLNLSPLAILLSLTIWYALWGVAGAFLAVPVTAIVAIVLSEFAGTRPIAVLSRGTAASDDACDHAVTLADIGGLFKAAARDWLADYAQSMGAALAFYTMFSIAPLLLIVIAIAGMVFGEEAARGEIYGQLHEMLGTPGALAVQSLIESAGRPAQSTRATVFGSILLLVGATSVFAELQDAFDRIWRAPARPGASGLWRMVRGRLLSLGMILGIGFLLMVSLVFSAAMAALARWWDPLFGGWQTVAESIDVAVGIALSTLVFAVLFKTMPRVAVAWKDVWTGAAVTSLLFVAGKFLIGAWLGRSGVSSLFGAAASLVIVLLWVYYSAQIFLFGAEFTRAYSLRFGSRRAAPPAAGRDP